MDDKVEKSSFKSKDSISIEENVPYVQSEEEKKLVKKINWTFVPFVVVILFIQVKNLQLFIFKPNSFCIIVCR